MKYILVQNANLINGYDNKPIENVGIIIKDNVIQTIGKMETLSIPDQNNLTIIDAEGGYILPGFIDTHVHLTFEFLGLEERIDTPISYRFYDAIDYMKQTIDTGVTTVRDAAGADFGLKRAVDEGKVLGPRMMIAINALTSTGGHSDAWRLSGIDITRPEYPGFPAGLCDGVEEVRLKTRQMLRAGADIVKIHATGGVMSAMDHPEHAQFSVEELSVAVNEAAARGKKVMAHAQGATGVKNAIRAGVHSIEHGIFLDDEAIELMLEHGTYLVPTLYAAVSVLERADTDYMPEYAVEKSREVAHIHKQSIKKAYEAGVKIAMGTDASVFKHGTNLKELKLMTDIGMSPMEAIIVSTKVAAECMGWQDHVGTIEEGKLADLILVKENPLDNIQVLENKENIAVVLKDGEVVKDIRNN